MGLMKPQIFFK